MFTIFKIMFESLRLAIHELISNKLRTFLSLLGITIGIFCIICVLSAVDSLEDNVRSSFAKLGNDVIYVRKFSWEDSFEKWWQYIRRPNPNLEDFEAVREKCKGAKTTSFHAVIGFKTLKYKSRSASNVVVIGSTPDFSDMFSVQFAKGRNLTASEFNSGKKKLILGHNVAETLFERIEPVGKIVKMYGQKYQVVGVIEKSGDDVINVADFDDCVLISVASAATMVNLRSRFVMETSVNVQAKEGITMDDLKDEVTGILRAKHRLKPQQEEDFSLNEISMMTNLLDQVFVVLNLVGLFIGGFAMIVGMFSVANIMFVSVKERTSLIGIKKAIGAQRWVILLEFLIESIILCILGGLLGLALVYIVIELASKFAGFNMFMSWKNIFIGVGISIFVGIVSGLIPAIIASKMDPVEAIRS